MKFVLQIPERYAAAGAFAYLADDGGRVTVVDASDPSSPTLAAAYYTKGHAYGIAVARHKIYVADADGGLVILQANYADEDMDDATSSVLSVDPSSIMIISKLLHVCHKTLRTASLKYWEQLRVGITTETRLCIK